MSNLISRQDAITIPVMPKEHRHYQTNNLDDAYDQGWFDLQNCINQLPSAQPYTDEEIQTMQDIEQAQFEKVYQLGYEEGKKDAEPERKKGIWLPDNRCGGGYWVCSSCKNPTEAFAANVLYKYCPFCGADMRGEEDDE